MPPATFYVRVQHGIAGGFAPATPKAVHTITRSTDEPEKLTIQSMHKEDGTADLTTRAPKHLKTDDHGAMIDELCGILRELPTEDPPGSEDIYGQDTSIALGSDDLEWRNGGPAGCGGGTSAVNATEEQKVKFKRALEIIQHLASA